MRGFALCALAFGVAGCAAPVMHARTGEVLHQDESRVAIATVLFVQAESSAVLRSSNEQAVLSGQYEDSSTGRQFRTRSTDYDNGFGILFSLELRGAHAFFEGCEVGGMLGWVRVGAELRCGLLDEREGGPFGAAVSFGFAQQIAGFMGMLVLKQHEDFGYGQEYRVGLDLSARGRDVTPLLNVGLGYIHQYREILDGLPMQDEPDDGNYPDLGEIYVWRDELRLSIPIGFAIELGDYETASRGRVIFAAVPEITLAYNDRTTPRYQGRGSAGSTVTDFEQVWAIFLTVGGEVEW